MIRSSKSALGVMAAAAALILAAGQAQAANHVLNLSGSALDNQTNAFTSDGRDYNTGFLALTGFTPFTLQDGDTVEVVVDITSGPGSPFVVPLAEEMFFGLDFSDILGGAQPISALASGFLSFDGAPEVEAGCGNCTSFIYGLSSTPLSFTNLAARGTFTLSEPYEINSIAVSYQVSGPAAVPEPGAWALMIAGFGGAGVMLRRRRQSGPAAVA